MTQDRPSDAAVEDSIQSLIDKDPASARRLLGEMGYSVEEWTRARNAPPAVEHGRNAAAMPPVG